jgi:SsrA-binding protein
MEKAVNIQNRKARHDYHFLEEYEAGAALLGSEVKSIKVGKVSLVDAYCYFDKGELWLKSMTVTPVDQNYVHEPQRLRKLLLHRHQLNSLQKNLVSGTTIIVTHIKSVKGRIKFCIALARGKKDYDKREDAKKREAQREIRYESNAR